MISGQIILITLIGNKPLLFSPADYADLRGEFLKPLITLIANKLQILQITQINFKCASA